MEISQETFDRILAELLDEAPASHLLTVPGVYEALAEEFNNAVLERYAAENEPPEDLPRDDKMAESFRKLR